MGLFSKKIHHHGAGQVDMSRLPRHIAIIMDGNGRWAKQRGLPRTAGHKVGAETFRKIATYCKDLGVEYLTVYAFSTENWKRPADEVVGLMDLFAKTMLAEVDGLDEENVRVRTIGDLSPLPAETREAFEEAWEQTRGNTGMTLVVAVNYGARQEILHAVDALRHQAALAASEGAAELPELTEEMLERELYTADIPDPDLVIRTSGELRISNFLLWQSAYAEYYFTDVLWPDFDETELDKAIASYQKRERRFGGRK